MSKCAHDTTTAGTHYGYAHSVAVPPYTDQNPAAAGAITYAETCSRCGAQRQVNQNGAHVELGTWGPSAAARAEHERKLADAAAATQRSADAAAARRVGIAVDEVREHDGRLVAYVRTRGGAGKWVSHSHAIEASTQHDIGDDLVPAYRWLAREIHRLAPAVAVDA